MHIHTHLYLCDTENERAHITIFYKDEKIFQKVQKLPLSNIAIKVQFSVNEICSPLIPSPLFLLTFSFPSSEQFS